jgi:hypothetical protein
LPLVSSEGPPFDEEIFSALPSAAASQSYEKCASGWKALSREQRIREAVLLIFCDPLPAECSRLQDLSPREWSRLLIWLDISGLALYFLDRMAELHLCSTLPSRVLARLKQNLLDNTERTRGMIAESLAIQQTFQQAELSYATLKGFSFCPESVPKPELRHQFDLDFLVTDKSAPLARQILERRGYRLYAISGRSWEFKVNETPGVPLKDVYKDLPGRSVELHVEADLPGHASVLERVEWREFHGIGTPVLPQVDLFLGQALHVYKHVSSEFSRTAHLLEFRRHVLARRKDEMFWHELRSAAEENSRTSLALGVVTFLITSVMGDFAPEALMNWTVDRLPRAARLWVEMYGREVVLGDFPGSKLYLLLQRELEATGVPAMRPLREALLPSHLPPLVVRHSANETLGNRARRYRFQLQFILSRLRFHIVEGLRYTRESHRWRQRMNHLVG